MSFFYGFSDELTKMAGPVDWVKKKLGYGKPAPAPAPAPKPVLPANTEQAGKALRNAPSGYKRMLRVLRGGPAK